MQFIFLNANSMSDMGNSIGIIGVAIFLIGIVALIGSVYLVNISFQTKEANGQGNPVLSTIFQTIGGAIGLIIVNSPVLFIINRLNRICVDKDDIACGMVLLIGPLLAILFINSIAVIVIIFLINRKKWGIAAGVLSIISLAAIIVGGFLTRQLWLK